MTRGQIIGTVVIAVLILLGVLSVVGFASDPFGWRKNQLAEAKAQAVTAGKQAELNGETVRIVDRTHIITHTIKETAHAEAAELREVDAGRAPLDPGLRDRWLTALERVRSVGAGPDDPRTGEPAPTVSTP